MEVPVNELHLFAGAGGGILAGQLLGRRCVCAVEFDPYAQAVLVARQNDGTFPPFPIWNDVRTFDGRPWRGIVDVVAGGFPCQDISAAGTGDGLDGERSGLWTEMARVICEVRPRRVEVENSPMLTSRGLSRVLGDLAEMGFDAEWGVISAADVGAPHLRERIWIVAHANARQRGDARQEVCARRNSAHACSEALAHSHSTWEPQQAGCQQERGLGPVFGCQALANADSKPGGQGRQDHAAQGPGGRDADRSGFCARDVADAVREREQRIFACGAGSQEWTGQIERQDRPRGYGVRRWPAEPGVGRVVDGMANRAHRIKALGNGQVSRVAATAWHLLG
ncbi:DNA cytosine methyltransferase [Cupriavidus sp. SZY C1]|uniref:DNA cytosine methyltransferase n=1 Tax=Cupriavidus sp. SZY C1 TaxID=3055037 RepID=UPI0039194C5D